MAAGMNIFTLMGSVMIDNDKANTSIKKTESLAEKMGNKVGAGIKAVGKIGLAVGGAAVAGGAALYGMATKAAETTDRIDKLSQKVGISRESFQEYEYILSQNGTSIEVMTKGMTTLVDRMQEATDGTGTGAEAFEQLGLSATNLNGELKTQEEMFEEAAKALMEMPESAEKSALAYDIFGKAGQELMPMLNGSAEGFDDLKQSAHDMGLVLSDEAIDSGAKFTDTMDNVKRSLEGIVAKIGTAVMPIIQQALEWVTDHMPEIQAVMQEVFKYIGIFVTEAVDVFKEYLLPVFVSIYEWVQTNWPQIKEIIKKAFETIQYVWDTVLKPTLDRLWDIFKDIFEMISDNWPAIQKLFETVFDAIKIVWENVLAPVLDVLLTVIETIVDFISDHFPEILEIVESVFEGVGNAVSAVTETFGWLIDKITVAWDWLSKWNKSEVKDKTPTYTDVDHSSAYSYDGSHANGLDYVPFDGYIGQLHQGERVLTKSENEEYSQGSSERQEITINTPVYLDGKQVATTTSKIQLQKNKGKARAWGVVTA